VSTKHQINEKLLVEVSSGDALLDLLSIQALGSNCQV
jgi:hypothetical protein